MGLFGIGGGNAKSFQVRDLADRRLKAAAELIDDALGTEHDDKLTDKDLKKAAAQLQKADHGAFKGLGDYEIQLLKDALLPQDGTQGRMLTDFLAEEQVKPVGPFATAIETKAILDPEVRVAAETVAKNFGTGEEQVNLTELRQAMGALRDGKLPDGANVPQVNEQTLGDLELFLMTGKGGLVTHEGVAIGGSRFKEAFPLSGDPDSPEVIQHYDKFFESCGYDLVFIKGPKPPGEEKAQLYVVLNESGALQVKAGMQVQMGQDGDYQDLGKVVATHDISNSFGEATWGFWGDVASGLVKGIRGKLGKNLDTQLEVAASGAAAGMTTVQPADKKADGTMTTVLAAGTLGAVGGAVASSFVAPAAIALGVSVSGFNLIDAYKNRLGRDKSLIFHAMGVGVNQERHVR
jgi:hypothetical protein